MLFNLVVEVLSSMIGKAVHLGTFGGIKISDSFDRKTHLQFADDTLLFIDNDIDFLLAMKRVLICFQLLSGLKIKFSKSKLYSLGKSMDLLQEGAIIGSAKI